MFTFIKLLINYFLHVRLRHCCHIFSCFVSFFLDMGWLCLYGLYAGVVSNISQVSSHSFYSCLSKLLDLFKNVKTKKEQKAKPTQQKYSLSSCFRQTATALGSMSGRLGGLLAPLLKLLATYHSVIPITVFSCLTLIGGFLGFLLPETKRKELPETTEEAERNGYQCLTTAAFQTCYFVSHHFFHLFLLYIFQTSQFHKKNNYQFTFVFNQDVDVCVLTLFCIEFLTLSTNIPK